MDGLKLRLQHWTMTLLLGAALSGMIATPALACTAFATWLNGKPLIAKNFDWGIGDGLLVMNPRGQARIAALSGHRWTSRYSSISLTVVGPGFPVSGMNEKGLVIEALVNYDAPRRAGVGNQLVSLEWAQRALDRYATVAEVIRDVEQEGIGQVVLPLHFFVCQQDGTCAIVVPAGADSQVVHGDGLPYPVVANNNFARDYPAARRHLGRSYVNRWFAADQQSFVRMANLLARQMRSETPRTEQEAFAWLDESAMAGLNVWQVLWQPQQGTGTAHFRASGRHFRLQAHAHGQSCQTQPYVRALTSGELSPWRPYRQADLPAVRARLDQILAGQPGSPRGLAQRLTDHTLSARCVGVVEQ